MISVTRDKDESNKGLHSILGNPVIYSLFGRLLGMHNKYRMYVDKFIQPNANIRILDIGCGTAEILNFLPSTIYYAGYDINPAYIQYDRKKYGHKADFYNTRVNDMALKDHELFDVVLADGLLHHINDIEAEKLFTIGYRALKSKGFMLTIDPVLIKGQNYLTRFICAVDRGRHVRSPEEYKKIALTSFHQVEINIIDGGRYFQQSGCILKCLKD